MFEKNLMQRENQIKIRKDIRILDNTLRDGEQTPGIAFSKQDKLDIIRSLYLCGVKAAEVGFPASSDSERDSIKAIVEEALPMSLTGLCRLNKTDIDYAANCGLTNITLFLPGSKIYIEKNLKLNFSNIIDTIKEIVSYAINKKISVKFSCENASRMKIEDILKYYNAALQNGASIISFPDTAGVMTPTAMYKCISILKNELKCEISAHCHNDLGLATANTLAAAEAGAIELQTCVNGLGERAGNASFAEVVLSLITQYDCDLGINLLNLQYLSGLVYERSSLSASFNTPFFGRNVFRHESAIHATAILRGENLYEPFSPSIIGRAHEIALGKHSGIASIEFYLENTLKVKLNRDQLKKLLNMVKEISEKKDPINLYNLCQQLGFVNDENF